MAMRESQQKMGIEKNGNLDIAGNEKKNSEEVSSMFIVDASSHFVTAIGDLRTALLQLSHNLDVHTKSGLAYDADPAFL